MSLTHFESRLLEARVAHQRLQPRQHQFHYGLFYRAENIDQQGGRLRARDHGFRDGAPKRLWADSMLARAGLSSVVTRIFLVAMPRTLGYVFNPVSFWLCLDNDGQLRAVLCEVNNTFGESHTYLCHKDRGQPILDQDYLRGEKLFHVSPFMDRQGYYQFSFGVDDRGLRVVINYYAADDSLLLRTSLIGHWLPDRLKQRLWLCLRYPLVTLKTIGLIHYHAVKLMLRRIGYRAKPEPLTQVCSLANESIQPPCK